MRLLLCVQIKFSAKWVKVSYLLLKCLSNPCDYHIRLVFLFDMHAQVRVGLHISKYLLERIVNFIIHWIVFWQVHLDKYWNVLIIKAKKSWQSKLYGP